MRWLRNIFPGNVSKYGQPRRRVRPIWRRPIIFIILFLLFCTPIGLYNWQDWSPGLVKLLAEKIKQTITNDSAKYGFAIKEIYVEGRIETKKKTLLNTLQVRRSTPIFAFNPKLAMERVISLPWVRSAIVERQLPDTVYLTVVERTPLALWQNKGRFTLIDTNGDIIPLKDIGRYNNLKIVVGKDAPKHAQKLFKLLAVAPKLAKHVKAAIRVGSRRWDIQMDNGVEVLLPELEAISAWVQLAELGVSHKFMKGRFSVVDLRLPDRIVLREELNTNRVIEKKHDTITKEYNHKSRLDT